MPKAKEVEIRACADAGGGDVMWTTAVEAKYFSVYDGEPGLFRWVADFMDQREAVHYAVLRAMRLGATFHNRIGEI